MFQVLTEVVVEYVCSRVDRLQGLALASTLHSVSLRHVDDGRRTVDEAGCCAVVELYY